jgi:hypothetical protein
MKEVIRMQIVNSLHDPLRPLNTCLDDAVGDRTAVGHSKKVIGPLHVHGTQDRGHNPGRALV